MKMETNEKEITENKDQVKESKFSVTIMETKYQDMIARVLNEKERQLSFTANLITVVGNNHTLKGCTTLSLVSGGLLAEQLKLSMAPALAYCGLVPYEENGYKVAQFQIFWKGLVQLAIRSGLYETIGVRPVHKGEVQGQDEFGDDIIKFDHKYDDEEVVGYFAYFKLLTGFRKTLYWTVAQCEAHGTKYSALHQSKKWRNTYKDKWFTDFGTMAMKTVLKQLISKFGVMSIELQKAVEYDQASVEDDKINYVDSVDNKVEPTEEEKQSEVVDVKPAEKKEEITPESFLKDIGYDNPLGD